MQPPKIGFSKKEKHHTSYEVQCFLGGEYRAVSNHGELLQSMHGALPAELMPHSFGTNKSSGQTKKSTTHCCAVLFFLVENTGIEPVTSCMPCKRSPERYRNTPPTRKCGDRLNIALIRSIHQKGSQLHPASRNHAPPTRQFYHPIFKCVNGFCSERRSFTRKVFSDSLLSAILILHIKVALFIFPKSIDKEVFSTMPMYYRCFLSMNQPHDP